MQIGNTQFNVPVPKNHTAKGMKVKLHKFCSKSWYQMEVSDKFQAQAPLLPSILSQQLNSHFTGSYPFKICNFIS
jgi:hypothetical protein